MKLNNNSPHIGLNSDTSILIEFEERIDPIINGKVHTFTRAIKADILKNNRMGILDVLPTYCTIQITFDSLVFNPFDYMVHLKEIYEGLESGQGTEKKIISIPVCYESPYAPDLEAVCELNQLSQEEVIEIHTSTNYLVYMLGFTPGFPYLGGMDKRIATPRRQEPRLKIEAGSVGIAGEQTGVYPVASPGGWQIIGRTPLKLFEPESEKPFLLEAGNYIKFYPIRAQEFERWTQSGKTNNK